MGLGTTTEIPLTTPALPSSSRTALRKRAGEIGLWAGKAEILEAIQGEFSSKIRPIPINLAGAIACVLAELEFDPLEMTGLAVMLYMPALIAHTVEEIKKADVIVVGKSAESELTMRIMLPEDDEEEAPA